MRDVSRKPFRFDEWEALLAAAEALVESAAALPYGPFQLLSISGKKGSLLFSCPSASGPARMDYD